MVVSLKMTSLRITFVIFALFLSSTFGDKIRMKRSLPWSIFRTSSTKNGNNIVADKILDSSNNALLVGGAGTAVPTADAATSTIIVNEPVQIPYSYPVWRIHKYDGIDLKPIPLTSFLQRQSSKLQPNIGVDENHSSILLGNTAITPKSDSNLLIKPQLNVIEHNNSKLTTTGDFMDLSSATELLSLAKTLGIKDLKNLPNLDEVMNLLGTTTQAETISTIKEIAATEDGKELILQFISNYDSNNSTKIENEKINSINDAKNKPNFNVPFLKTVDATLDRTHTNLGILKRIVTTPKPITGGFFNTITSFFKPLSPEIEIPKIVTEKPIVPYNPYYVPQKLFYMPHFNPDQLKIYSPFGSSINEQRPKQIDVSNELNQQVPDNSHQNKNKEPTSEIGRDYYKPNKPFISYGPPQQQFKQILQTAAELPSMANYFNHHTLKGSQKPSTIYGLPSTENHQELSSFNSQKISEPSTIYGLPSTENHQESFSFNSPKINEPSTLYGLPSTENHQESSSFNSQKISEPSTIYGLPSTENHQESFSFNSPKINEPSTLYGLPSTENHQESSSFNNQKISEPSTIYGLPSTENHQESFSFNSPKINEPSTLYGLPSTENHQESSSFNSQKISEPSTLYGLPSAENHQESSSFNSQKINEPSTLYGLPSAEDHQESSSFNSQKINEPSTLYGLPSAEDHQESSSFSSQKINQPSTLYGLPSAEDHQELSSFNSPKINEPSTLYGLPSAEDHQELSSFNSQKISEPSTLYGLPSTENHQESSSFNSQKISEPSTLYGLPSTENHQESSSFNSQKINEPSTLYGLPSAEDHQESSSFKSQKINEPSTLYGLPSAEDHQELSSFNSQKISEPSTLYGLPSTENHQESSSFNSQKINEPSTLYGLPSAEDHQESSLFSSQKINQPSTLYGLPSAEDHQELSSFNSQKINEPSTLYGLPSTENHQESSSFNSRKINEPSTLYGLPSAESHQESSFFNNKKKLYGPPLNENHSESSFNQQTINEPSTLYGLPLVENHQQSISFNHQELSKQYGQPILKDDHKESFLQSAKINEISTKTYGPPQFQPNNFYNLNNLPTYYNQLSNKYPTRLFRLPDPNNVRMAVPPVNVVQTPIISDISQLPLSQETNFNNKPVLSSYLVKTKPFNLDGDTEFSGSETITERISLDNLNNKRTSKIEIATDNGNKIDSKNDGPQRISLHEFYATGKINRANSDAMTKLIPTEKPVDGKTTKAI